ncbi:hypothetical protein GYMLUDRAFT_921957 [Collybiopsis luxurians FD-317 M1]|uniref:Uncharacterized protein n=1 Tax=Collybiopsis luxurians FD-317 M1 TaxID=944289 RepID=A0A0D0BH26_9AGAR|nr:hypothetical protein GYMLUDRAFT_921957 [Collybiopsis luxurians FD-317 M1]
MSFVPLTVMFFLLVVIFGLEERKDKDMVRVKPMIIDGRVTFHGDIICETSLFIQFYSHRSTHFVFNFYNSILLVGLFHLIPNVSFP